MKKPKIKKFENGLTLMVIPSPSPSVTVMTLVATGSYYERKAVNGISHFLEHMCFKGTYKQTGKEIMRYLDGLGAETNAFTSNELTGYYVKSITKHWKKTLRVVSDIFLNAAFPELEMEKEKGVIVGEISMYEDIPMRHVHDVFNELVYGDQPAGRTILGPRENIKKMTRDDFVQYHAEHYVADATTIVIAGNILFKEALVEVQKQFKNILTTKKHTRTKVSVRQKDLQVKIVNKKTDQSHMVMGYHSFGLKHKDLVVSKVIASVLGGGMSSRLFETLREDMGVGYYVSAHNVAHLDTGMLQVSCGVDSTRVPEVLTAIIKHMNRLKDENVSDDELVRVKEYIIGNAQMGLEATDDQAYYYGQHEVFGLGIKTPTQFRAAIKSVTPRDIKRVAKKIIDMNKLNLAIIGPHSPKDEKIFKKALK